MAFAVLFLALWRLLWVDRRYFCRDTGENVHVLALKPVLHHLLVFFSTFEFILSRSNVRLQTYGQKFSCIGFEVGYTAFNVVFLEVWRLFCVNQRCHLPRYGQKCSLVGFETSFTAFAVPFLALWRLFWVDQRYCCLDTGENDYALALKPVLRLSLIYFYHLGWYFESIKCTVVNIREITFISRPWNRFFGILCSIFSTGDYFASIRCTVGKIREKIWMCRHSNRFYGISCYIFSSLEVFLSRSNVWLPKYGWKRSCACFETGFTAFAVVFLPLWMLFWVNRRYSCQDKDENINFPALTLILRHSQFYF